MTLNCSDFRSNSVIWGRGGREGEREGAGLSAAKLLWEIVVCYVCVCEYVYAHGNKGVALLHPSMMVVKYTDMHTEDEAKNKHFSDIVRQTPTGGHIGQIYIEAHLGNSMSFQRNGV